MHLGQLIVESSESIGVHEHVDLDDLSSVTVKAITDKTSSPLATMSCGPVDEGGSDNGYHSSK